MDAVILSAIETFLKFVENYGILATIVFALCGLIYRQQNNFTKLIADQKDERAAERRDHAIEMAQRDAHIDRMLTTIMAITENNATAKDNFATFKDDIIKKADDIAIMSSEERRSVQGALETTTATLKTQVESVDNMNEKFESLELAIREMLQRMTDKDLKVELKPEVYESLVNDISVKLKVTMEQCLTKAIRSTQETPVTKPEDVPEVSKTKAPTKVDAPKEETNE
jgi:hypothetical protein